MIVRVVRNILDFSKAEEFVHAHPLGSLEDYCPLDLVCLSTVDAFLDRQPVAREEWTSTWPTREQEVAFVLRPQGVGGVLLFFQIVGLVFAISQLFKRPPSMSEPGSNASPSYGFGGIGNSRVEGFPLQIIYGRFRTGGQVINEYTQSRGVPSQADLYQMISFGHGPVEAIGDIVADADDLKGTAPATLRLEDNPAENYDDITAWVRMGSSQQATVPFFHRVFQVIETAFRLNGEKTSEKVNHGDPFVSGDPFSTDYDQWWDKYGETVDITQIGGLDGLLAKVRFERGLYKSTDDGALKASHFSVQFRYQELDGLNAPITTGGLNGDGWVRTPPERQISTSQPEPFDLDYAVGPIVDPQTWTAPTLGNALNGTAANPVASAAIGAGFPKTNVPILAWGISCWIYLESALSAGASVGEHRAILSNYTATAGFRLSFVYAGPLAGWELRASFRGQKGGGTRTVHAQTGSGLFGFNLADEPGVWHHIAASYGADKDSGNKDRVRLFIDGFQVSDRDDDIGDSNTDFLITEDGLNPVYMFHSTNHGTYIDQLRIDDVVFLEAEIGSDLVDFILNRQSPDPNDPNLNMRARWQMDETSPTVTVANDVLIGGIKWFDDAALTNCDTDVTGVVFSGGLGTAARIKIRLQALRLNYDMKRKDHSDDATLAAVSPYVDEALSYPTVPILALQIRATEQLNTTVPTSTIEVKGMRCPFWNGASGTPTGYKWTQNPAWVVLDIFTNASYGLGNRFSFAAMDMDSFLAWATYCDEAVYDGSFTDGEDQGFGWDDIRYDAGTTGPDPDNPGLTIPRGSLAFIYSNLGDTPAEHFKVGRFIRPAGVPVVSNDINVDDVAVRGYEIKSANFEAGSGAYEIVAYWDRLSEAAPWTSGTLLSASATVAGSSTGGHNRFQFNGVFDIERDAWEAILDVCAVGRAIPIKEGRMVRIAYQRPLPTGTHADAVLSRGDMVDGSFRIEYTGPQDKPLVYEIEYLDEDELFERQVWRALSPVLTNAQESRAEDMRTESIRLFGVTHRAQAERHANFMHNVNQLVRRAGEFRLRPSGIRLEPGDVVLFGHDILPRGVSGLVLTTGTNSQVIVAEDFEILAATTYYVYIRGHLSDAVERGEVDTSVTTPGVYAGGGTITLTTALTSLPTARLTPYVLVASGEELRGRITETILEEDLTCLIRWNEYSDALFADDATQTSTSSPFFGPQGSGLINSPDPDTDQPVGADRPNDKTLLDGPVGLSISEALIADGGSGRRSYLQVGWRWPANETARVNSVRVHIRETPGMWILQDVAEPRDAGDWIAVGDYDGAQISASVPVPFSVTAGSLMQVAVQGITLGGTRRRPDRCPSLTYRMVGSSLGPPALAGPAGEMDGTRVKYSWTAPASRPGLQVEARRGGWILGQSIASAPADDGRAEPQQDWAGAISGDEFLLQFATRDAAGQYGGRVPLSFTPAPDVGDAFQADYAEQAWEEYADGWKTDSVAPLGDPQLTDMQRHADGFLEFAGSATSGTYDTWDPQLGATTLSRAGVPYRAYIEATAEADQVHPISWEEMAWAWGDPRYDRWTWEGPAWVPDGETANAGLAIHWRFTRDGTTWSDWGLFQPGEYALVDLQFRLSVTRPNADYQVRILRFHTRARLILQTATDRDAVSAYIDREI